jgi:hypothetical protein
MATFSLINAANVDSSVPAPNNQTPLPAQTGAKFSLSNASNVDKPSSALDILDSKLRQSEAKLFSADTPDTDKDAARKEWTDTYVQRMKEYSPIERAGQYVPSAGELVKSTGKALSGAQQTVENLLPEYMDNPVKAAIAGMAQVPRVLAETGRAALNLGANIGEEAVSGIAKATGDDALLRNSAEEALLRLELNKKFGDAAEWWTEKTYGKEKTSFAKLGEFVTGAALPLGGAGKAVKALETASEMGGKAALATAKAGTTVAKKGLQTASGIAEAVIPKAAETKLVSGINDFIQNGAQPLLEKRILNLQKELARDIENIPMLGLTEEQGLARVSATADKIAASQNTLQNYISLSNFTKNASANAIKGIASTLTAAGLGGALGGSLAAATSEKPGDKEAALAGFGVGAATGGAVKGGAEALNTVGQALRGAVSTIPIKPGDKINVSDLYDTAADVISGKKSGEAPIPKEGEVTFVADSGKNIMDKAPTMDQVTDLVTDAKRIGSTSAVIDPKLNRFDPRYVSLTAASGRVMGEIPREARGARPLEAFAARQQNVERSPTDRVLSYSYHPEHGMIYAEFVPTVYDNIGSSRGISHYVYDQITPEMGAKLEAAPDKAAFIKSDLETNPSVRAIGIANNTAELQKAVELHRAGKLNLGPAGEMPPAPETTPEAATATRAATEPSVQSSVATAARQTKKEIGGMFKEAESKIKESLPKTREDLMVELRGMNERMERQRDIDIENESIAAGKKQKADEVATAKEQAAAAKKQSADEAAATVEKAKLSSIEKQNQSIIDQIVEKEGVDYQNVINLRKNKTDQEWNQYLSERLGQADVVATRKAMLGEEKAAKSQTTPSFTTEEFNKRKVNALNEFKERNIPLNSDTEIAARVLAGTKDPREYNLILKNVTDLFVTKPDKPTKPTSLKSFQELESPKSGETPPEAPPAAPTPVTPPPEPPAAGPSAAAAPAPAEIPVVSNPEVTVTKTKNKITLKPSEKLDSEVSQLASKKQMAAQKDYLTQNLTELEKSAPDIPELKTAKDKEAYARALQDKEYYSKGSGRSYTNKVKDAERILSSFNDEAPKVTIKVPGDGQYTIVNTKTSLASFRDKIESKFGTGLTVSKPANKKIPKMTEAERAEWQEK